MTPIGIAVIGTGCRGPNLVRDARAATGLDPRYPCDLDVERARRVLGGSSTVAVSGSLDEVLADPAVAAVAIAGSAATHLPVEVSAHGSDPIGAGRACVAHLTMKPSNGSIAQVHVNWSSPNKIRTAHRRPRGPARARDPRSGDREHDRGRDVRPEQRVDAAIGGGRSVP